MKLKDQVCSLKLAKKLKELGVKQKSLFGYIEDSKCPTTGKERIRLEYINEKEAIKDGWHKYYSAFTSSELGEMLRAYELECVWFGAEGKWGAFQTGSSVDTIYANTEVNARVKLLCFLIENGLTNLNYKNEIRKAYKEGATIKGLAYLYEMTEPEIKKIINKIKR